MMSEEHSENGRINDHGEEEMNGEPRQSLTTPPDPVNATHPDLAAATHHEGEPVMEFFEQKGEGEVSGSDGDSPRAGHNVDNVSHHSRSYVTVSPSVSPVPVDTSAGHTDAHFGTEQGHNGAQNPDEVVKPKPLSRRKLQQPCVLGDGVESQGQDMDLKIEIAEREKVGSKSDVYISYKICTKSSRPSDQYEKNNYAVWRRYKDFEWLREVLEKHHFTLIVPPLPGKQLARYFDQKSEEFLDERQKALDKFLKRLAAHPYFSFNKHLKAFLTAEPTDFNAYVMEISSSNRLLGAMASSVKMAANSFRLKNPDPGYTKELKYFEELGEKLGTVERIAMRLHSERAELVTNMEEFSSDVMRWAMNEPQLVDPIREMGTAIENSTSALQTLNENNAYTLMMTAREYQLYCASGVSAVRRRDGLQLNRERAAEEREKRKKVHDDAAAAGKLQKLPKLADDLQRAGIEAERTLDDLSVANEQLRVDVEKWKEEKDKDMAKLMVSFADNHINYHTKCFDEWGKVLSMLRDPKSTPAEGELNSGSEGSFTILKETSPLSDEESAQLYSPDLFT